MNQTITMLRIIEKKTATGYPTEKPFVETHDIYPRPVQAEEPARRMAKRAGVKLNGYSFHTMQRLLLRL